MNQLSIHDHIQTDHKAYATYDNGRNIPHIADGLKPSLRKIVHTAVETMKGKEEVKVAALGSRASDYTDYKHGEASIIDAVITIGRDYSGTNNMPLLKRKGQFGTIIDNEASDARYIHVTRHSNLSQCFVEADRGILQYQVSEGKTIEPLFFLPPLPLVLINASSGVGNGYSSNILPRKPENLIKMAKAILNGTQVDPDWSIPHFPGFKGRVKCTGPCSYEVVGAVELNPKSKTEFTITSLPPSSRFQYETYKERELLKRLDEKVIKSFDSDSNESGWNIRVTATREYAQHPELVKKMGMIWRVTENLTVWNWDGQLKRYETAEALMRAWLDGRAVWMEKRRLNQLSINDKEMDWLKTKIAFLRWWNEHHADAVKMENQEIKAAFSSTLPNQVDDQMLSRLLAMPVGSLKLSGIKALEEEMEQVQGLINYLNGTTAKEMILKDMDDYKFN